ncbi:IS110 family transposase [Thioalkalivibrio denitrificans]|uniref:IS110 family transposase n=1 Tax=Thioalkalivibrio denitrificans TaxID=108003 RepID=A0A1V3N609_9GAMM|nr:IS110 family transposase [Thioalkalivibrio denitrificans]OOG20527.1 IS110 family transposase [Thioalkalivibrio denitrificans]
MMTVIGIDISAQSFDLVSRRHGRNAKVQRFEQSPQGHARAIRYLKGLKPECIVMEATGVYYLDLALALHEADLPVCVINPRSFRHFAEIHLTGSKTDAIDAALLAEYAERMTPRRWTPPPQHCLALRDIGRQINRLIHARTQAKNRLHALSAKTSTPGLLIEDEQDGIAQLDRRIERLKQAALELIAQSEALSRHFEHMSTARGMGQASSVAVLAELCTLPSDLKAAQVSRHAGLDVRLTQSGSSVNSPGRLSKAGNAYLRAALYMPAMAAIRHEPRAKAFYEALVARGKKKIQALCAVMRKYLTGLWACIKTQTPFDAAALFSDQHLNKA